MGVFGSSIMEVQVVIVLVVSLFLPSTEAMPRFCPKGCTNLTDDLQDQINDLHTHLTAILMTGGLGGGKVNGAVYTRWGRKDCPRGANLIYDGVAGGSHYTHNGGGVDYLCLPHNPQFNKTKAGFQSCGSYVYGAEYELCANDPISHGLNLHDNDVPCAVCQSVRPAHVMIPARFDCPSGWQEEYQGYLMTAHHSHKRTKFICVDEEPAGKVGGHENKNGALLYAVEAQCGSLPCPNYISGFEITCVVCTK